MAEALLQAIISGLAVGGAYALVALGFSITFTTTKTLNFSHGEFVSAGAFIGMSVLFLALGIPVTSTTFGQAVPGAGAQLLALAAALGVMGVIFAVAWWTLLHFRSEYRRRLAAGELPSQQTGPPGTG